MKQIYQLLFFSLLAFYTTEAAAQTKKPAAKAPAKTTTVKKTTTTTQKVPAKAPAKKAPVKKPVAKAETPKTAPPMPPPPTPPTPPPVRRDTAASNNKKPITIEAALMMGMPLRSFAISQELGIGMDALARYALPDPINALSVGARVNYMYFFKNPNTVFGKPHGTSLINLIANVQYDLPYHIIAGGGIGLGIARGGGSTTVGLAKHIYAGYELAIPNYTLVLSGYFSQSMRGTKNAGIRVGVKF